MSAPSLRPDRVYALALYGRDKRLILGYFDTPFLTIPGGSLRPEEEPEQGLRRIVYETLCCDCQVVGSIGPRHVFDGTGDDAMAYEVVLSEDEFVASSGVVGITKEQALGTMVDPNPVINRMIWDGFSVMEVPVTGENQVDSDYLPIEGIYVDPEPHRQHVLVEEIDGERREWARLDPTSPTGKMEPKP